MKYLVAILSTMLAVMGLSATARAQCEPSWSPGFEMPSMPFGILRKSIQFDDGSGPALFAINEGSGRAFKFQNGSWQQAGERFFATATGVTIGRTLDMIVFDADGAGPGPSELYVSGGFRRVGRTGTTATFPCTGIAKWSPTTGTTGSWVPVATTFTTLSVGGVVGLAVQDFGTGPRLYAAGNISSTTTLAVYNGGTSWSFIPSSTGGVEVRAIAAYTDTVPKIVVGGRFTSMQATPNTFRIAAYNGTAWGPITTGVPEEVYQIVTANTPSGQNMFIFGSVITNVGWGIVRWDGTTLQPVAAVSSPNVGNYIFNVNDGINPGESIYVGKNNATTVVSNFGAPMPLSGPSRWNGTSFIELDATNPVSIAAMGSFDPDGAGPQPARLIVTDLSGTGMLQYVNGSWSDALAFPDSRGFREQGLSKLTVHDADGGGPAGPELVGIFTTGGLGITRPRTRQGLRFADRVLTYSGGFWERFGAQLDNLRVVNPNDAADTSAWMNDSLSFDDGTGSALYIGGTFTHNDATVLNHVMKWNGVDWAPLGTGVANLLPMAATSGEWGLNGVGVQALTVFNDGSGAALYAGGNFVTAGGNPANYVAKWNGSAWSPLGAGLPGPVTTLEVYNDGSGAALYAATSARTDVDVDGISNGNPSQVGVFKWTGSAWMQIGTSEFVVRAMAVFNGELYVGGIFASIGGDSYNHLAKWNGTIWSPVSTGVTLGSGFVDTLHVGNDGSGSALFVGGSFKNAGGVPVDAIAKWDGTAFSTLGAGLSGDGTTAGWVAALAMYDDGRGPGLFASGPFTRSDSGLLTSRMARWGVPTPLFRTQPSAITVAAGGTAVFSVALDASLGGALRWQRNGVDLIDGGRVSGATGPVLTITGVLSSDAGAYRCVGTNGCGQTVSVVARLTIPCVADFNQDGTRDVADIFAFLSAWFASAPSADFDNSGTRDVADIFAFLSAWFAGC